MGQSNDKKSKLQPVLLIDHLSSDFGTINKNDAENDKKIRESDKILLTLIASVVVEIVIREEL